MKGRRRKYRIIIERYDDVGRDALNTPIKAWAPYCQEYAAVYFGSGSEQREAAQIGGAQAATFEVLSNGKTRGIRLTDRIQFDGGTWDIRAVAPLGLNEGVKINAVRASS